MREAEAAIATVSRDVVGFLMLVVLGILSAVLVRSLTRTVIAGLLVVTALVMANLVGLAWFDLDFLWETLSRVVQLLPSLKELLLGLLQVTAHPLMVVGYVIGLLIGLIGFRNLL